MESSENHRAKKIAVTKEFPRIARDMVSPKFQSCSEGCRVFVGSQTEESPDENRSKRSIPSGRETQKAVDDVKLRVDFLPELPGEMIEKIISLIPFPRILTARALTNKVITGLDCINWTWVTLWKESLDCEAPRTPNPEPWESADHITSLGSLVCIATRATNIENPEKEYFAYNVFTRAWKWLPPRPACEPSSKPVKSRLHKSVNDNPIYLIPDGPDSYKVLILTKGLFRVGVDFCVPKIVAYLYESRSNSWTIRLSKLTKWLSVVRGGVYCNGVIYFDPILADDLESLHYSANIVESGYWDEDLPPLRIRTQRARILKFIVWENQLLLSSWGTWAREIGMIRKNSFNLYKVDPVTGGCDVIYTGPPESIPKACAGLRLWHGDSIFFGDKGDLELGKCMLDFNIRNRTWTLSPPVSRAKPYGRLVWSSTTFEPGRNPFITV
ncbi:hypothetical protein R1sor_019195 [Riccia sorocarpa]|uniref:F-box domain-containing protein n=1 Tax=Riccia sorocarpa TaxID=122646 RepID=A0ABD3IBW1_9MARC